ncbi:DUF2891 domain-containing protein [Streptomyces sp. NPDC091272]|uniref:DUF2891 domain-containing protein n=1 Tax=Streptomyces sp. NPDC091272 TaxID=3365981 RepID=UPI003810C3CD
MSTHPAPRTAPPDRRPLATHARTFSQVAAANVTRPYPYAPMHLIAGPDDVLAPREQHPAFYGAYDWHSSVHMHWLLVRLLRRYADEIDAEAVTAVLDRHLTTAHLRAEAHYLAAHPTFERPYGWAWLLLLEAECRALGGAAGTRWADALAPAVRTVAALVRAWLPKATYPVRHGTHANSAFALGLVLDSGHPELTAPVSETLLRWFADDHDAPAHWEPSGQDFLSPALTEADAVRRVLAPEAFAVWLDRFLPALGTGSPILVPPTVADPADPQIGHLIGLSLSRAYALRNLAAALPSTDPRTALLRTSAKAHLAAALPHTGSGDFTTDHWLATFAALALESPA